MLVANKAALLAISKITFTWELPLEVSFTTTLLIGHVPSIYWMKNEAFCLKQPYDLCFLLPFQNQHKFFFLILMDLLMPLHLRECSLYPFNPQYTKISENNSVCIHPNSLVFFFYPNFLVSLP